MSPDSTHAKSLRARLLRGVAGIAATLLLLCALSTVALTRLGGAVGLILRENYASVVACQEMNEALERQDSAAQFATAGREEIARPMLETQRPVFARALDDEAHNITIPGEGALVAEIQSGYREYVERVDAVLAAPASSRGDGYFKQLLPRFHTLKDKITAVRILNQRNMEWADHEARLLAERTRDAAIFVTAFALAFSAWLVRRLPAAVLGPLDMFTARARAIGEGKFDFGVPAPEMIEFQPLADALNRMQEKLRAYRESSLGELLAAKDLSRATIAAMTDPVLVFSARGEVLLANEAAETIFAVGAGDADELRSHGVDIPDPIAVARDVVLASGAPLLPQSLADAMRWMASDGERHFLVRATPLQSDDAAGAAVIVIAQDVTRFRKIDVLKSDVVATVSHELKTPLTSLRLATHMLLEDASGPLNALQRELAQTSCDETERLQRTVDELLDLVRIERDAGALQRAEVSPAALLEEVVTANRALAELKQVSLEVDASGFEGTAEVDGEQIAIIVGNLVSNAIRHSAMGATVTLGARADGDDLVLSVRDRGEGIPPEHLAQIFERHWSGAEAATLKGRHGLGLAIAKDIATRHNGTLEVRSERGRGSLFELRIPRRASPTSS